MRPEEEDKELYRKLLRAHDWFYDYADDHRVWTRGVAERDRLRGMRQLIDRDGAIWNEIAPEQFKVQPLPPPPPVKILPQIKVQKPGGPGKVQKPGGPGKVQKPGGPGNGA